MPRNMRVQYAGAIYHVLSRGDRCEKICLDDMDRQDFLRTRAETCQKNGCEIRAYCLLPDHFHMGTSQSATGQVRQWMKMHSAPVLLRETHKPPD